MDQSQPLAATAQRVVCPNCGTEQDLLAVDQTCANCGHTFGSTDSGRRQLQNAPTSAPSDPATVAAPMVSGGIGGVSDGTQVTHHVSSAVPGKPMAPIADEPSGSSTDEAQAMDTPASSPHAERGGSGG